MAVAECTEEVTRQFGQMGYGITGPEFYFFCTCRLVPEQQRMVHNREGCWQHCFKLCVLMSSR
jgi:hypothetical protein